MKASSLRKASLLIEALDNIDASIQMLDQINHTQVVAHIGTKQMKYKPPKDQYKAFLTDRRATILGLLNKMGVEVNG